MCDNIQTQACRLFVSRQTLCTRLFLSVISLLFLQQRPNDYGIPVAVEVTYVQDNFLTSDVLNEMVLVTERLHLLKTWTQT